MAAHHQLDAILQRLAPSLDPTLYVFCTRPGGRYGDLAEAQPLACILESEGLSLVLPKVEADARQLAYDGCFRRIRLGVHSSLHSVGLSAQLSQCLAAADISLNIIAGFYHDHLLVPDERAVEALERIRALSNHRPVQS